MAKTNPSFEPDFGPFIHISCYKVGCDLNMYLIYWKV